MRVWLVLFVLSAGCVTELLQETDETTRNIACAFTDPGVATAVIHIYGTSPMGELRAPLAATGRDPDSIMLTYHKLPEDVDLWLEELVRLESGAVHLHVLFDAVDGGTMEQLAPGVLRVSKEHIAAGAEAIHRGLEETTTIVTLHGIGHLLGVVNAGIPINGTATEGREVPMHHEASPRSIMHAGWHHVGMMPETNASYNQFSAAVIEDWQARSVC